MRLARQTDETGCGAIIAGGLPTVLVGGATVDAAPPDPLAAVAQGAAVSEPLSHWRGVGVRADLRALPREKLGGRGTSECSSPRRSPPGSPG
jgi:hypothetical protein